MSAWARFEPERRKRRREGKKLTKPMREIQFQRDEEAQKIRDRRRCQISLECQYGGFWHCARKSHRKEEFYSEPEVEILRDGAWTPIRSRVPRWSDALTWKRLREEGAFA